MISKPLLLPEPPPCFPFDRIKIDRACVADLGVLRNRLAIIRAPIAGMAPKPLLIDFSRRWNVKKGAEPGGRSQRPTNASPCAGNFQRGGRKIRRAVRLISSLII